MLNPPPELPVYPQLPVDIVKGEGPYVFDDQKNRYLDLYAGHAVASIGHCHPKVTQALSKQAAQLYFYSNATPSEVRAKFCETLMDLAPEEMTGLFLCNSGAEANENALSLARTKTGRKKIIAVQGGFHGRTLLTLSLCGLPNYRKLTFVDDTPLLPWIEFIPANDPEAVETIDNECAAVIVEPVQGLAGAVTMTTEFLHALRSRCDQVGAALIFDEVQCGSGRCGAFTAGQVLGVTPDMFTLAKGLAGGFPIGAVLCNDTFSQVAKPGSLGSTFGGGPMACAAGLATLQVMKEENLFENAKHIGELLKNRVRQIPGVKAVTGLGLLLGICTDVPAKEIQSALLQQHQIIAGTSADPNVLRLLPPLCITENHVDIFVDALTQILQ